MGRDRQIDIEQCEERLKPLIDEHIEAMLKFKARVDTVYCDFEGIISSSDLSEINRRISDRLDRVNEGKNQ